MKKYLLTIIQVVSLISCIFLGCGDGDNKVAGSKKVIEDDTHQKLAYNHIDEVMDKYHNSFNVYTNFVDGGNHFNPSAWMKSEYCNKSFSEILYHYSNYNSDCYSGTSCIEISYTPCAWAGIRYIEPEYNDYQGYSLGDFPGYNLQGASQLTLWAKGSGYGNQKVEFFVGGINEGEYPDTIPIIYSTEGKEVRLTNQWKKYTIDLTNIPENSNLINIIGGFGFVSSSGEPITFYLDEIKYDVSFLDDLRFIRSFETISSTNEPDKYLTNICYTYDNALALIAYIAKNDLKRARILADSFIFAQKNDGTFHDNRLRNGYMSGDIYKIDHINQTKSIRLPGIWNFERGQFEVDEFCSGSHVGNVAWAMLALITFYETVHETKYLTSSIALGEWIENNTRNNEVGGYSGGYELKNDQYINVKWISTEHNIDVYAAFERLYRLTNNIVWHERANHAKLFIEKMWNEGEGHLWTGRSPDGETNKDFIPLDVHPWALMALNKYNEGLSWCEQYCYTETSSFKGFDFSYSPTTTPDGVWFEGTAQMALAYQINSEYTKANIYIKEIEKAQEYAPNTNGKGIVAASIDELTTFISWKYYSRLHIGATAWFIFAKLGYNPYWGLFIDEWKEQLNDDVNSEKFNSVYFVGNGIINNNNKFNSSKLSPGNTYLFANNRTRTIEQSFESVGNQKLFNINESGINSYFNLPIIDNSQNSSSILFGDSISNEMIKNQVSIDDKKEIFDKLVPKITITSLPPINNRIRNIEGKIYNIDPGFYKIAIYIHIPKQGWRLKPYNNSRNAKLVSISQDSEWTCDITVEKDDHKANIIQIYLVPMTFNPLIIKGYLLPKEIIKFSVAQCRVLR